MAEKNVGPGKEFFSEWHRDTYIKNCERDVEGCKARLAELAETAADEIVLKQAKEALANAEAELERFKPKKKATVK